MSSRDHVSLQIPRYFVGLPVSFEHNAHTSDWRPCESVYSILLPTLLVNGQICRCICCAAPGWPAETLKIGVLYLKKSPQRVENELNILTGVICRKYISSFGTGVHTYTAFMSLWCCSQKQASVVHFASLQVCSYCCISTQKGLTRTGTWRTRLFTSAFICNIRCYT